MFLITGPRLPDVPTLIEFLRSKEFCIKQNRHKDYFVLENEDYWYSVFLPKFPEEHSDYCEQINTVLQKLAYIFEKSVWELLDEIDECQFRPPIDHFIKMVHADPINPYKTDDEILEDWENLIWRTLRVPGSKPLFTLPKKEREYWQKQAKQAIHPIILDY